MEDAEDAAFVWLKALRVLGVHCGGALTALRFGPARRELDRPADLALDHRAVAVVVRLAAAEIERDQIGDDVLSERPRRQIAHAGLRDRVVEDRATGLDVERAPRR